MPLPFLALLLWIAGVQAASWAGAVTREGEPAADVAVYLYALGKGRPVAATRTAPDGHFDLGEHENDGDWVQLVAVARGELGGALVKSPGEHTLTLQASDLVLHGRVLGAKGKPEAGTWLAVQGARGGVSGPDGRFAIPLTRPPSDKVPRREPWQQGALVATGESGVSAPMEITADQVDKAVKVRLVSWKDPSVAKVRVTGAAGEALVPSPNVDIDRTIVALDDDGVGGMVLEAAGTVHAGWRGKRAEATIEPGGTVELRFPSASITVTAPGLEGLLAGPDGQRATWDVGGDLHASRLEAGHYEIWLHHGERDQLFRYERTLAPGEHAVFDSPTVPIQVAVTGRLVDGEGNPLATTRIRSACGPAIPVPNRKRGTTVTLGYKLTDTDADGRFAIACMPPGQGVLRVNGTDLTIPVPSEGGDLGDVVAR